MFKFLKNLFKLGKQKEYIDVEIDEDNGRMLITTNKKLTMEDVMDILRENLGDEYGNL